MSALFTNNASSRMPSDLPAGQTSIVVTSGEGVRFPSPTPPDYFMVTIEDRRTAQIEICRCTARSGDVLTVIRAQEGTTGQSFHLGATVSNRLTAGTILNFAGTPEAPADGKIYGRQDSGWTETITKVDYDADLAAQDIIDAQQDSKIYNGAIAITGLQGDIVRIDGVNATQNSRLNVVESDVVSLKGDVVRIDGINSTQDGRLTAVESKNTEQDNRLTSVETKNNAQDAAFASGQAAQDALIAGKLNDAPSDSQTYGRHAGAWVDVPEEAPNDGISYGRKNGVWVASVGGAVIAEAAPPGPLVSGQLWWESDSGNLFVYYDDASSQQWVQVSSVTGGGSGGGGGGSGVPIGSIVDFAGTVVPAGWMLCFGQTMSRVLYGSLFAAIGTAYGAGDGSTTFNLPDCRGRVAAGKDDMGGTSANRLTSLFDGDSLGAAGGTELEALDITKIPSHTHGGATGGHSADHTHYTTSTGNSGYISVDHSHNSYFNSGTVSVDHTHNITVVNTSGSGTAGPLYYGSRDYVGGFGSTGFSANHTHLVSGGTGGVSANHYHGTTVGGTSGGVSANHTHTVTAQGGGVAHNNVQPTIVFNKLIKVV